MKKYLIVRCCNVAFEPSITDIGKNTHEKKPVISASFAYTAPEGMTMEDVSRLASGIYKDYLYEIAELYPESLEKERGYVNKNFALSRFGEALQKRGFKLATFDDFERGQVKDLFLFEEGDSERFKNSQAGKRFSSWIRGDAGEMCDVYSPSPIFDEEERG